MKTKKMALAAVALAVLLLPACGSKPASTSRIDVELTKTTDPEQQIKLLKEAQKRFGTQATKKQ